MTKSKTFWAAGAVLASIVAAIMIACAGSVPPPAPPAPPQLDATAATWTWYQPDSGWAWLQNGTAQGKQQPFAALAVPPFAPGFVAPLTDTSYGLLVSQPGYVYQIHCVLQTTGDAGTPLYVMGFDINDAGQMPNGAAPIYGSVSGGLSAASSDVTYSDMGTIGATQPSIHFYKGLQLALSATADTYTAPNASAQMRCDAKLVGSP